jgi:hypothetical protein
VPLRRSPPLSGWVELGAAVCIAGSQGTLFRKAPRSNLVCLADVFVTMSCLENGHKKPKELGRTLVLSLLKALGSVLFATFLGTTTHNALALLSSFRGWGPFRVSPLACLLFSLKEAGSRSDQKVTWLILPVVICLSQRLSHACLSINNFIL